MILVIGTDNVRVDRQKYTRRKRKAQCKANETENRNQVLCDLGECCQYRDNDAWVDLSG
jgi:hypothetical protein